jgi:predicted RNA binding protein YcfA (HicA-like mRNA interferase family)
VPSNIPAVTGAQVVKALQRAGFTVVRINGSHHMMRHRDGRGAVIPVHGSKDLLPGLMRSILRTVRMTLDEFHKLL